MSIRLSCGVAALAAIILGIVSRFTAIPPETIPLLNVTLSRWWDILFAVIYVNLIALPFLYRQEIARIFSIDVDDLGFGLALGLEVGLWTGLLGGLMAGLGTELGVVLGVVLGAGLLAGLVAGFCARPLAGVLVGLVVELMGGLGVGVIAGVGVGLVAGVGVGLVMVMLLVVLRWLIKMHIKIADTTK